MSNHVQDEVFSLGHVLGRAKRVLVRTVTNYYVGVVTDFDTATGIVALRPAVWVADTGRLNEALTKGTLKEYEELPDGIIVMLAATVDLIPWRHEIPTGAK